jgi:lipid A 3-O-deacylase
VKGNCFCPWILVPLAIIFFSSDAFAQTDAHAGFFSINEENDAYSDFIGNHQDRHYTHGIKLTYIGGDDELNWATNLLQDFLPPIKIEPDASDFGIALGQNIYTPQNILSKAPIPTDRPYAGWLYAGAIYQRRAEVATNFAVMENFEMDFGVIGPDSFAQQTQTLIHKWRFPQDIPQGWGNQLKDEPGLILKYARLWRWSPSAAAAKYVDILPRAGLDLGNVFTFATAGSAFRLGYNLPKDFGEQIIDSPASANGGFSPTEKWFSVYTFAGVDGRAIARDITLDGNTFRDSPSIAKNYFVGDLSLGAAIQFGRHVELAYVHINRTKEFRGQNDQDIFGSLILKVSSDF